MSKEKETQPDILDSVKRIEKQIKGKLLFDSLIEIKKLAKDVLIAKEKTRLILEELGIEDKDIKRIIDFVNSLPEVELTEKEKENLREEIRDDTKDRKKEVERKFKEMEFPSAAEGYAMIASTPVWDYNTTGTVGITDNSITYTASSGDKIDVNL